MIWDQAATGSSFPKDRARVYIVMIRMTVGVPCPKIVRATTLASGLQAHIILTIFSIVLAVTRMIARASLMYSSAEEKMDKILVSYVTRKTRGRKSSVQNRGSFLQ
jgi:hypothetical protein